MTKPVSRNDLCPCGSGRKYKHCCAGKLRIGKIRIGVTMWVILAVGVAAIVGGVVLLRPGNGVVPQAGSPNSSATSGPPGEPWAYDSVTKRHYDPGHGHWHDGPPPPLAARGLSAPAAPATAMDTSSGPPPAAWTHDVAGNRHWDPNHGHWHPGPPPPGAK